MTASVKNEQQELRLASSVHTWGSLLTHMILVPSWVGGMALNPVFASCTGWGHGFFGMAVGLATMVVTYIGPDSDLMRVSLLAIYWALAASAPSLLSLSAALCTSLITSMVCGKPFASNEAFYQFMTSTFPLKGYYTECELRGALDEIKAGRNCIAAYPHGAMTVGLGMNLIWNCDLHRRTGRINFLVDYGLRYRNPQFRLLADSYEGELRTMAALDAKTIGEVMQKGESMCFLPGGFTDATIMAYGRERIALHGRKGWVKHCLRGGYRIIPAYTFGESSTFFTFQPLRTFRLWLNTLSLPGCIPFGNPFIPFLPRRDSRILTYVGPALLLPQIDSPSAEDVEEWHGKYVVALKALFDKHKAEVGQPEAVLEFMNAEGLYEAL